MKRINLRILVATLLLLTIGIVSSVYADDGPVVLRVALHRDNTPIEDLIEVLTPFSELYPHIQLDVVQVYGENLDQLTVEMIAGVGADVFASWDATPLIAMQNGFTLDLMPYIVRDGWEGELRDFLPATLSLMTHHGELHGLPQYQAVGGVFYNRDIFDRSGTPYPDGNWDWDEFAQTVRRLTRVNGELVSISGFNQFPQWIFFFPWLEQAGVSFDDPYVVPLGDDKAIEAVEFVNDLIQSGFMVWDWPTPFFEQRSAMTTSGAWELTRLGWYVNDLPQGVTAPPTGPSGRSSTLANSDIISINRNTPYPEEAWTFLKWFYTPEVQLEYLRAKGLQPARMSLVLNWIEDVHEFYRQRNLKPVVGIEAFITNSAFARPQPFFADPSILFEFIDPALTQIFASGADPVTTLKQMSDLATKRLQEKLQ